MAKRICSSLVSINVPNKQELPVFLTARRAERKSIVVLQTASLIGFGGFVAESKGEYGCCSHEEDVFTG